MPQLDISTYSSQLFWLVICFFSMYFIMAKLIIPRIADIMEQRQNKIDDYISRADEVKRQAEESLVKYRSALSKATAEADKTLEKTQLELSELISRKQNELDQKLKAKIAESEAEIENSKVQALKQIQSVSENLALEVIRKIGLDGITGKDIKSASKKVEIR